MRPTLCLGRELAGDRISRWQSIEEEFLVLLAVCLGPFGPRLLPGEQAAFFALDPFVFPEFLLNQLSNPVKRIALHHRWDSHVILYLQNLLHVSLSLPSDGTQEPFFQMRWTGRAFVIPQKCKNSDRFPQRHIRRPSSQPCQLIPQASSIDYSARPSFERGTPVTILARRGKGGGRVTS